MTKYEKLLVYDFLNFIRHYDGTFTDFNEIKA